MQEYVMMVQADEDDQYLTESILAEWQDTVPMRFAGSMEEIKEFSVQFGSPAVILINNQDHRHAALEIVIRLKADPAYDFIPIVVLGEITTAAYIQKYYRAGASSYIVKPSTIAGMKKKIRLFLDYWFEVAEVQSLSKA